MGVAKVILNGNTLIDTTGKTVAADKMLTGYTALDKAGESITGTYSGGSATIESLTVTPSVSQQVFNGESPKLTVPRNTALSDQFYEQGQVACVRVDFSNLTVGTTYNVSGSARRGVNDTTFVFSGTWTYTATSSWSYNSTTGHYYSDKLTYTPSTGTYIPYWIGFEYVSSNGGSFWLVFRNGGSNSFYIQDDFVLSLTVDGYCPVTVNTDANLVAGNIRSGVSIFGVTGSYGWSGLEYEQGTVTLPSSTSYIDIPFSNTHTTAPTYYVITLNDSGVYSQYMLTVVYALTESAGVPEDENYNYSYGAVTRVCVNSSGAMTNLVMRLAHSSASGDTDATYPRYWATETRIRILGSSSYAIGGTYCWIAIWQPTT